MLWHIRPDRQGADSRVADEMRELVAACADEGLLLIVELLTYPAQGRDRGGVRGPVPPARGGRRETGRGVRGQSAQVAVPGLGRGVRGGHRGRGRCAVGRVVGRRRPRRRSSGRSAPAMANGASGAMAGRSLWKDSLSISHDLRKDYLTKRALPRLHELAVGRRRRVRHRTGVTNPGVATVTWAIPICCGGFDGRAEGEPWRPCETLPPEPVCRRRRFPGSSTTTRTCCPRRGRTSSRSCGTSTTSRTSWPPRSGRGSRRRSVSRCPTSSTRSSRRSPARSTTSPGSGAWPRCSPIWVTTRPASVTCWSRCSAGAWRA